MKREDMRLIHMAMTASCPGGPENNSGKLWVEKVLREDVYDGTPETTKIRALLRPKA